MESTSSRARRRVQARRSSARPSSRRTAGALLRSRGSGTRVSTSTARAGECCVRGETQTRAARAAPAGAPRRLCRGLGLRLGLCGPSWRVAAQTGDAERPAQSAHLQALRPMARPGLEPGTPRFSVTGNGRAERPGLQAVRTGAVGRDTRGFPSFPVGLGHERGVRGLNPGEPVPRPLRQTSRPVDLWFRSTHTTSRAGSSERCSPLSRDDSSAAKAWSWPAQRADVGHASVSACAASGRRLPSAGVRPRSRVRAVSRRAPNAWVDCCRHAGSAARARQAAAARLHG
jgi:hypothetical protein